MAKRKRLNISSSMDRTEVPSQSQTQSQPQVPSRFQKQSIEQASSQAQSHAQSELSQSQSILGEPRKTRGRTCLVDVWNMPEGEHIIVQLNADYQPIGDEGGILAKAMGMLVRNPRLAPLNFKTWHNIPDSYKIMMWEIIESKFEIVPKNEIVKRKIMQQLSGHWRSYKCELKSIYFDDDKSERVLTANVPKFVNRDQWAGLVSMWKSEEGKRISEINKQNRAKLKESHTIGTKSIPRLIAEMKAKEGKTPTRAEVYIKIHRRKDGNPVDEESARNIEKLNALMAQGPETSQNSHGAIDWEDDYLSQVFGPEKRGRIRCMGNGPRPKTYGVSYYNLESMRVTLEEERRKHCEEVREVKEQLKIQADKVSTLEAQIGMLLSTIQKRFPEENVGDTPFVREVPYAASGPSNASSSNHPQPAQQGCNKFG